MDLTIHKSTPKVTMGHGILGQMRNYNDGKIAIVLDAYLLESDIFKRLQEEILINCDYKVICDIKEEPSFESIDPYISIICEYKPKYVVAIGGGSTIDTAKALWMFYERPELDWKTAVTKPLPSFQGKAKLIAVPTTSGTGSEATGAAVYKSYDGTKAMIISDEIRPNEAFLDYDLIISLPKTVVANAGIDALAHVLGAMSCKVASILDKMICTEVAVTIIKKLPKSYKGDISARAAVHVSAYLAGDEINNAGGGLEHKLDMFAKAYHIPHGLIIGIFMPYTMLYLLPENHYVEVAEQLGIKGDNEEKQRKLIDMIWEIYDEIGIPRTIKETGIPEEDFIANIPKYIEQVKAIGHIYWIQGFKGDDSLEGIYKQAYYGIKKLGGNKL